MSNNRIEEESLPEVTAAPVDYVRVVTADGKSAKTPVSSFGGGGSGVQSVTAGVGIGIAGTPKNPVVVNTGVLELIAGDGVVITGSAARPVISAPGGGGGGGTLPSSSVTHTPASGGPAGTVKSFLDSLWSSAGSSLIRFLGWGDGATPRTLQSKCRDVVSVLDYPADPTGSADSTSAFVSAMNAAQLNGAKAVYAPAGTYILNTGMVHVPDNVTLYGDGASTIFRRRASSTNTLGLISLGNFATLRGVHIDGNYSAQTAVLYGVVGYRVRKARVEKVTVNNNNGIGVGWSDCSYCVCDTVVVENCKASSAGFWNGTSSSSSFYGDGGHSYINCTANDNQLDGIIIGTKNNTIIGGNWDRNGYGGSYDGALGGAGIFTLDNATIEGLAVSGVSANSNGEYGINCETNYAAITGNSCKGNQLAGIFMKGGTRNSIANNTCVDNGWYPGSANPNLWVRGGIVFTPSVTHTSIVGNTAYDSAGASGVQEYGIRFAQASTAGTSTGMSIGLNAMRGNKVAADNFNPSNYRYTNLTNMKYYDYLGKEVSAYVSPGGVEAPTVAGTTSLYIDGNTSITNLVNGLNTQFVTLFVISGTVIVRNNANIQLVGGADLTLEDYMSNVTLSNRAGIWYETSRSVF